MGQISFNFSGERYVVTGASSGMGRKVALELASSGADVLALGRNEERLQSLYQLNPEHIVIESVDVCNTKKMEDVIASFVTKHGKLKGGVHAAGIMGLTPLRSIDVNQAKKIMDVSFWAGISLLRLITKAKYGERGTSTVLFSSVCAESAEKGMLAYAATKAAINSGVRSVAKEVASKGHRVNSILPGWVISPMTDAASETTEVKNIFDKHPLGAGNPEDVSGMVLFLLSNQASWITGSNVVVDGGYLA